MLYSVIIPVYNRPKEVDELLDSLTKADCKSFEVIIVDDGSSIPCKSVTEKYTDQLNIRYFEKENSGQGFTRNFGFERAKGDYFVVFDSDCLIPSHYFSAVNEVIDQHQVDCWGGPDRAHASFTSVQKAINYSMTSFFTTGGIRGNKDHIGTFHPRSFNMGISREVFEKTGGYKITRMGEDIEFSIRIKKLGFITVLIENAYVYHKRRTSFLQFFRQLFFFGRARINISRFHHGQIRLVHTLPVFFVAGLIISLVAVLLSLPYINKLIYLYIIFGIVIGVDAFRTEKSLKISLLSILAGFIQLMGYGAGFIREMFRLNKRE